MNNGNALSRIKKKKQLICLLPVLLILHIKSVISGWHKQLLDILCSLLGVQQPNGILECTNYFYLCIAELAQDLMIYRGALDNIAEKKNINFKAAAKLVANVNPDETTEFASKTDIQYKLISTAKIVNSIKNLISEIDSSIITRNSFEFNKLPEKLQDAINQILSINIVYLDYDALTAYSELLMKYATEYYQPQSSESDTSDKSSKE